MVIAAGNPYPIKVDVPYEPFASRLKVLFRLFLAIPAWAFASAVSQVAQILGFFAWCAIIVTGRYPMAMWRFNFTFINWMAQVIAYSGLLRDEYPRLGPGSYPVAVRSAPYPAAEGEEPREDMPPPVSSRWRVGLRGALALPQVVIVSFVNLVGAAAILVQWFAILFSGRRPEGLSDFIAAVLRWNTRVIAYLLFIRDEYPPYSGAEDASTTGSLGEGLSAAAGGLALAGLLVAGLYSALNPPEPVQDTVAYRQVTAGDTEITLTGATFRLGLGDKRVLVALTGGGADPAPEEIIVARGQRLVKFTWRIENQTDSTVAYSAVEMKVEGGGQEYEAIELRVDGRTQFDIKGGEMRRVEGFFEIPVTLKLDRLVFRPILGASTIEITFTY